LFRGKRSFDPQHDVLAEAWDARRHRLEGRHIIRLSLRGHCERGNVRKSPKGVLVTDGKFDIEFLRSTAVLIDGKGAGSIFFFGRPRNATFTTA